MTRFGARQAELNLMSRVTSKPAIYTAGNGTAQSLCRRLKARPRKSNLKEAQGEQAGKKEGGMGEGIFASLLGCARP